MKIQARVDITPTPSGTEIRLRVGTETLTPSAWALSGHAGVDVCQRLLLEGVAIEGDDLILVDDAAIVRLTAAEAARLALPPATTLRAVVEGSGVMVRPDFSVKLRWTRPGGQNVLGIVRIGAWLQEAEGFRRLPESLFAVAQAVDGYSATRDAGDAARLSALAALRAALPPAATAGTAQGSGMLGTVTILEADALSLAATGDGEAMQLVPVLHRSGDSAPLLPEDLQHAFGQDQFHRWPGARSVYTLPGSIYLIIAPPLRQALDVVRQKAAAPLPQRRAFLREPRAAISAAIGDEADAALIENLVVETPSWSERVIGLGLWQPRVLPWVAIPGNEWFGPVASKSAAKQGRAMGLQVGDSCIALSPEAATELAHRVGAAIAQGLPHVIQQSESGPVEVPATTATLQALSAIHTDRAPEVRESTTGSEILVIKPNEIDREIQALVRRRTGPLAAEAPGLRSTLKAHQREGLHWLQESWNAGSPGVLLADEMGLGKTLQGLAFLVWLRHGMAIGCIPRTPLLVVAPTGLLENWRAEHDRHLVAPGLGTLLPAYGRGLATLRRAGPAGRDVLDAAALAAADWVLTTYETLRDYDRDFGQVRFAAMLLDEAQKVKTPGIRLTDAAKAMNADFRVAMTGTPVENRLADLWCIVDGVAAGHLGDLRRFSARYETDPDPDDLAELKASLDRPLGQRPPLLLRRLARDRLPDLPPRAEDVVLRAEMTNDQLAAYESAIELGRGDQGCGRVLEALQRLRAVSLHPSPDGAPTDEALVAGSARLRLTLGILDEVATRGERALVFLDDLGLMARLSGLLQRRYHLANPPMTISGKVAGATRQARVDRFQAAPHVFDAMLLSPRAGGVGLTLTRANHVIHLARWWNPAVEDQCTGRVLRIGQDRPVAVYVPLAVLPNGRGSFDENLQALLSRKRRLMHDALLPPDPEHSELATMLSETLA